MDVRINETGSWGEISGLALTFVLPEAASIRVLYSMSVMPDQNFANEGDAYLRLFLTSLSATSKGARLVEI